MRSAQDLSAGFRLDKWIIRPEDGSLTCDAQMVRLEPLLMQLLVFLCTQAGRVVSKDEILTHVWQGRFVSDDTVKASFYQLRKSLGDDPRRPHFIETLPKRGYRILLDPVPLVDRLRTIVQRSNADPFYQKGIMLLSGAPSITAVTQARLYFERATEADAEHSESAAALAHTYVQLVSWGLAEGGELLPRAKVLALRSVELAPDLTSAHVALGAIRLLHDRDVAAAESELRLAIRIDDRDPTAHRWYAKLLSFSGRHPDAIAEARRALFSDPLSLVARRDLVETLFIARAYSDAIAEAQQLVEMAAHAPEVSLGVAWIYCVTGNEKRAFDAVFRGFRSLGMNQDVLDRVTQAFVADGMAGVLRLWAGLLEEQAALGQKAVDLVFLYALIGDKDRAFSLMDKIVEACHPTLLLIPCSPLFDDMRADLRYAALLRRLASPRV